MRKNPLFVGSAAVLLAAATGTGIAVAAGDSGDDGDATVTGRVADRARAAALDATGGGRVNAVERDSEDGATWEVEVTRRDGTTVDVRLDDHYQLVVVEGDQERGD